MNSNELEQATQAFINKGNAVQVVTEGTRTTSVHTLNGDPALRHCACGCHGDYTAHSMRAGEGRFADQR